MTTYYITCTGLKKNKRNIATRSGSEGGGGKEEKTV